MTHAAAGRSGETGDEADHRFVFHVGLNPGTGIFLGVAADLTDHDHGLGFRISGEGLEAVDEVGAVDRVTADANDRGLAEADTAQLVDGLVGERPGAGNNTPGAAGGMHRSRHDADLTLAGGDDTRAVGADEAGRLGGEVVLDLHHVQHRNTLGDADNQLNPGVGGFHDGVGGKRRRYQNHRGVAAGFVAGVLDRVEDRHVVHLLAALTGGDAGNHVGAVGDAGAGVELAFLAGDALHY